MEKLILTFMIIISVLLFFGGLILGFAAGKDTGRKQMIEEMKEISKNSNAPNKH